MGIFELANRLDVLLVGRNPQWRPQDDVSGAPDGITDGQDLADDAPVTYIKIDLRETLRWRTGRVTVDLVQDATNYEVEVRSSTAVYGSSGSADEPEIVNGIVQEVNALRLDVRARSIDQDGDGNDDEVRIESNHSCLSVASVSNSDTYFVAINGVRIETSSDSTATEAEILDDLATAINQASVKADARPEDTTGNGDTDTLFIAPIDTGSLDIPDAGASGSGDLTIEARGLESDNPHYGIGPNSGGRLSLDADASKLDAVRWYQYAVEGSLADNAPDSWAVDQEWGPISYRGFDKRVLTTAARRGYLEAVNTAEGSIRRALIGPAVEESHG
jgi:hypothetical protein